VPCQPNAHNRHLHVKLLKVHRRQSPSIKQKICGVTIAALKCFAVRHLSRSTKQTTPTKSETLKHYPTLIPPQIRDNNETPRRFTVPSQVSVEQSQTRSVDIASRASQRFGDVWQQATKQGKIERWPRIAEVYGNNTRCKHTNAFSQRT